MNTHTIAFCASTLLAGHQEEHMACKNWLIRCWHGYMCRWFAYDAADATNARSSLAWLKSRLI